MNKKPRITLLVVAVLVGILGISACVTTLDAPLESASQPETIEIGIQTPIESLDPSDLPWDSDAYVAVWMMYDPLVRIDSDGILIPSLAESWTLDPEQGLLTMDLREGIVFHDETPLDAEHVVAAWERYEDTSGTFRASQVAVTDVNAIGTSEITVHFEEQAMTTPQIHCLICWRRSRLSLMASPV